MRGPSHYASHRGDKQPVGSARNLLRKSSRTPAEIKPQTYQVRAPNPVWLVQEGPWGKRNNISHVLHIFFLEEMKENRQEWFKRASANSGPVPGKSVCELGQFHKLIHRRGKRLIKDSFQKVIFLSCFSGSNHQTFGIGNVLHKMLKGMFTLF